MAGALTAGVLAFALARVILSGAGSSAAIGDPSPSSVSRPQAVAGPRTAPAFSSPGPARVVHGIPTEFTDTEQGAVAAAATYLRSTESALLSGSSDFSAVIRALTVEPLRSQALSAQPAERLFSRARAAGPWFAHGYRLGYRLESYTPSAAQVAVWTFGIAAGVIPAVSDWATTTLALRFASGDWKVSAASTAPGPTPPPASASAVADAAFARAAQSFKEFPDAP